MVVRVKDLTLTSETRWLNLVPQSSSILLTQRSGPVWRQRFSRFHVALKLDKESGEVQVNSFLYSMGRDTEPIYSSFVFPASTEAIPHPEFDIKIAVEKFDEHFLPTRNTIHDRACFQKRIKQAGETVEAFVHSLYKLAHHC